MKTQRPSRINTPKRCPFHYMRLESKSKKSRNTWRNRQIWPWSTEWSGAKANSFVKRKCWSQQTPFSNNPRNDSHGYHQMVNTEIRLITFFAAEDRDLYRSAKIRPGADCGSYHELIIAKFRLKLKKLGKTTDHSGMTKIKSLMITQWRWWIDSRD